MKKTILILAVVALFCSCTSDKDFKNGKSQLENMGYSNVRNTGYNAFCCSDSDDFSTGFECIDKQGKTVKGCFCSSVGKGLTIRFE